LSFDAFNMDDFQNGVGQLNVLVNGQLAVDIPAGVNHLTGTGEYAPYDHKWISFGPFDITSMVVRGENTIVFMDSLTSHNGLVRNVKIVQGNAVLLSAERTRMIGPRFAVTYTFSNPPLVLTSFTASTSNPSVGQRVTFTAAFTGGTAPFTCRFDFGDGESTTVTTTSQSCSATHTYDDSGSLTATVRVKGSATADKAKGIVMVNVQNQNSPTDDEIDSNVRSE
jgi:PKD repeat protein